MPTGYLRSLTHPDRTAASNRRLARYLAFIAGAEDAAVCLATGHYTSHMSGVVSGLAVDTAQGRMRLAVLALASVCAFTAGSACTTLIVRWARRRNLLSCYALPLLGESALLALAACLLRSRGLLLPLDLLCFAMGMQNAMITKISGSVIRTTHVTGIVTDIGITAGRLLWSRVPGESPDIDLPEERQALVLLTSLVLLFLAGGLAGALAYPRIGAAAIALLAAAVLVLSGIPVLDDSRALLYARRAR